MEIARACEEPAKDRERSRQSDIPGSWQGAENLFRQVRVVQGLQTAAKICLCCSFMFFPQDIKRNMTLEQTSLCILQSMIFRMQIVGLSVVALHLLVSFSLFMHAYSKLGVSILSGASHCVTVDK